MTLRRINGSPEAAVGTEDQSADGFLLLSKAPAYGKIFLEAMRRDSTAEQ